MAKSVEFSEVFKVFEDSLVNLHHRWLVHQQVYLSGDDNLDLLNHVAPEPLAVFEDANEDAIVLQIGRFCDTDNSGKVVSLAGLLQLLPVNLEPIRATLQEIHDRVCRLAKDLIRCRHTRLAHANVKELTKVSEHSSYSQDDIESVLAGLDQFGNHIHEARFQRPTSYIPSLLAGGRPLISALKAAQRFDELANAAGYGEITPEQALSALKDWFNSPERRRLRPLPKIRPDTASA